MTTIPERIRDEARLVCNGFFTAHRDLYVDDVAQALLAVEKRGREEAAKIADKHAAENWGHTEEESAGEAIAAAIRSTN